MKKIFIYEGNLNNYIINHVSTTEIEFMKNKIQKFIIKSKITSFTLKDIKRTIVGDQIKVEKLLEW